MKKIVTLACALLLTATVAFAADKPAAAKVDTTKKAEPAAAKKDAAPATAKKDAAPAAKGDLIDINTASEAELKAIPGIGDAYAKKIVEGRPYKKKDQLTSRKILPADVYAKVKDKIIAKQSAAPEKAKAGGDKAKAKGK
jgi:DNA uptake protein ComE-like DNA-binding protein